MVGDPAHALSRSTFSAARSQAVGGEEMEECLTQLIRRQMTAVEPDQLVFDEVRRIADKAFAVHGIRR